MARPEHTKEVADVSQMRHAAMLYYEHDLSKTDIGKSMGLDARKVAALLDEARRTGIVRHAREVHTLR